MTDGAEAFLISEYESAHCHPVYIRLQNRSYLIPYCYIRTYPDYEKAFRSDYFDVMRHDYNLYKKYHEPVRYIRYRDENDTYRLIVPFIFRNRQVPVKLLTQRIFERADRKYRKAVALATELAAVYQDESPPALISLENVRAMQKKLYEYQLQKDRSDINYITQKIGAFFAKNPHKETDNLSLQTTTVLKSKARKWALRSMLAATISAVVYNTIKN